MKKVLLLLFLIAASMGTIKLRAYCFYNKSNYELITVKIYAAAKDPVTNSKTYGTKATHTIKPRGGKACWNWKEIDKKDRKKQWGWRVYTRSGHKLGEGFFPIGGAIIFTGYDENTQANFSIKYDHQPWEYHKSPWNWPYTRRPWRTYKR